MSSSTYNSFTNYVSYNKSLYPKGILPSKVKFPKKVSCNPSKEQFQQIVVILSHNYNRQSTWTENHVYRFLDDLYGLYQFTEGRLLYSFENQALVEYFRELFLETNEDIKDDMRKYGKDSRFVLGFPNAISYQCMRCILSIEPQLLDTEIVLFIRNFYLWLEENAITGTRLNTYNDDRYSLIKNKEIPERLNELRKRNGIDESHIELDRLSNTHIIMLWKKN